MSNCNFDPNEIASENVRNSCFDVAMNAFAKNSSPEIIKGLTTSGACTCMAVIVHDMVSNTGCLGHLGGSGTNKPSTFDFATQVIEKMIKCLTNDVANTEIFLFEGMSYTKFGGHLKNTDLAKATIHDHLKPSTGAYVYFPSEKKIQRYQEKSEYHCSFQLGSRDIETIDGMIGTDFWTDLKWFTKKFD